VNVGGGGVKTLPFFVGKAYETYIISDL